VPETRRAQPRLPGPATKLAAAVVFSFATALANGSPGVAGPALACGAFSAAPVAAPAPRQAGSAQHRAAEIDRRVKTEPYRVLFLGDSLVERFDPAVWQTDMAPRGVLNAGVSGDRTDHLLWRLEHGNLAGPAPAAVILLIGTNDLTWGEHGHGRSPEEAAEGIRSVLLYLREHLPQTRILLLGLWPRAVSPDARLRHEVEAVNRLIRRCGDGRNIVYADLGGVLLDGDGRLSPAISPDHLHFSPAGYQRLAPRLDALIDGLLAGTG
jgi:lysophospholipase L1-like esterase